MSAAALNDDGPLPQPGEVDPREEQVLALQAAARRLEQAEAEVERLRGEVRQLALAANADDNPHRLGARTIGAAVGKDGMTVYEWLYGPLEARRQSRRRCRATAGHTGDRCRAAARPGEGTCWHHRDVPTDQLLPPDDGEVAGG